MIRSKVLNTRAKELAMAEAVRFYWRGRDASIPVEEIPEEDRHPLRIRRNVVQRYTPDVVKQLTEDRFVAAAWEDADIIFLILCHPNIAKMPADAFLVDAKALPRVVLKLRGWDEIPDVTRLFLTAFGSEAATVEECATAREALIQWLAAHSQPEMARIVKHFSTFPFGIKSDALEVINIWRQVMIKGQREQIDRVLDDAGRRFERIGWTRDAVIESQLNLGAVQRNRFYCWSSGPNTKPRVLLCLNRATDRRIRGGTYHIDQRAGLADLADAIQFVLTEVIEPAAATAGLEVSYPHLGPISLIGAKTEAAMAALGEVGDGCWPLPDPAERVWRKFLVTALRDDVAINPEELTAWFTAYGWDERAANELTKRFYAEAALLEEYDEERQPA
ncbi:hypothetical protein BH10PLA2_BH10PLA2_36730 [soil metagenome]